MDRDAKNAAIAAAAVMLAFGVGAYYLPAIVIALGDISPFAGGAAAVLFVAAFFLVFWLRGRSRGSE